MAGFLTGMVRMGGEREVRYGTADAYRIIGGRLGAIEGSPGRSLVPNRMPDLEG